MTVAFVRLLTPSKQYHEKLRLTLPPFEGKPDQDTVATALYELHLSDPDKLDDSWEFPSLQSRSSSTSLTKSYEVSRARKDERAKERKEAFREKCVL